MLKNNMKNSPLAIAIEIMSKEIRNILADNNCTIYIYGSVSLNDFQLGWSDIDILSLTEKSFYDDVANRLVNLRQELLSNEPSNPYYHSFEGAIVHANEYLNSKSCKAVYWGTSGQRITNSYVLDCFSKKELLDSGWLVCGEDIRSKMSMPSYKDLFEGIVFHYETIRNYAVNVPPDIKSYGWILDISRCIYTLKTGQIISKTKSAEWALENGICPVSDALNRALLLRKNPLKYKDDHELMDYTTVLGADIQSFADVLEREIEKTKGYSKEKCSI